VTARVMLPAGASRRTVSGSCSAAFAIAAASNVMRRRFYIESISELSTVVGVLKDDIRRGDGPVENARLARPSREVDWVHDGERRRVVSRNVKIVTGPAVLSPEFLAFGHFIPPQRHAWLLARRIYV
jgi:hypothetical protein